jgi:hypothetical protein
MNKQKISIFFSLSLMILGSNAMVAYAAEPAVNIDFQSGGNTYEGLGVLGSSSDTMWNSVGPLGSGGTNLLFADGSGPSGISVTTTHGDGYGNSLQPNPLHIDWVYSFNLQETITISGLTPNAVFDISFYDGFYWQDFTIPGQPGLVAQVRPPGTTGGPCGSPSTANSCNGTINGVSSDWSGQITIIGNALAGGCCGPASTIAGMQILQSNIAPDTDGDAVPDNQDNCPAIANPLQENNDGDAFGDVCDADDDNDGTDDVVDNCPIDGNPDQADFDYDGLGDACDTTINAGSIAQHVEDKVAYIVRFFTTINVSGGNGMISKLTGNGGVIKKMSSAISAYNGGYIDLATYVSELDGALSMLDAFDNQIEAKISKGKIIEPYATAILDASAEIRNTINNLKVAAGA